MALSSESMAAKLSAAKEGEMMSYKELTSEAKIEKILALIPQQAPFRFIDRILEIDNDRVMGQYTFRQDEWFYRGHFPGRPVTPGVILLETMAQIGIVTLALHKLLEEGKDPAAYLTLFQDAQVEFLVPVFPGDTVTVKAEATVWRRGKIKAKIDLFKGEELAVSGVLAGMGVKDPMGAEHAKV